MGETTPALRIPLDESGEAVFMKVLSAHQIHARVTDNITYCGRWSDSDPATDRGLFHLIDSGSCLIKAPILEETIRLDSGDLIMFPRGHAHMLCDVLQAGPGAAAGPTPPDTVMLCGEFTFATGPKNPIVDSLPDYFVVRGREGSALRSLARVLASESSKSTFGSRTVLDKLADALFVMAVRSFIESSESRRGLLAALFDPRLARALAAIHTEPGKPWTVASLAEIALQSRTAFAQHFSEVLGTSPIDYLTQWRMTEAVRLLRDPRQTVAAAAEQLGYQTEAAFRRAFKNAHGFGPGQVRRAAAHIDG